MTTERSTESQGLRPASDSGAGVQEGRAAAVTAMREARGALAGVSRSMPDLARASRGAMDEALQAIERGSDERLSAGVALSLGLSIGLLIGGAPRMLVALTLVPLAAIGLTLADRRSRAARASGR